MDIRKGDATTMSHQLFAIRPKGTKSYVITWALSREDAKKRAHRSSVGWNGDWSHPDSWDVIPITEPGARVHLELTLSV